MTLVTIYVMLCRIIEYGQLIFPVLFCILQPQTEKRDLLVLHLLFLPSRLVLLPCLHTQKHCYGYQEVHLSHVQTLLFLIGLASHLCKSCFHQNSGFSIVELVPNHITYRITYRLVVFSFLAVCS